jgi:thiol-disulfide isomerase/thioredoxin
MKVASFLIVVILSNTVMAQEGRDRSLSEYAAELKVRPEKPRLPVLVGQPAPEILISKWFNAEPIQLRELRGKVVLLDFWAMSCPPCVKSIPQLHELGRSKPNFVVVTIHPPKTPERKKGAAGNYVWTNAPAEHVLPRFIKERKFTLPVGIDRDGKTANLYVVKAVPLYVLIDGRGVVRYEGHSLPSAEQVAALLPRSGPAN